MLQPVRRLQATLAQPAWEGLWPRFAVGGLNYGLAFLGVTMFLGALGPDGDAPWASEMRRFLALTVWPSLAGLTILLAASIILGFRGWPWFIVPVSILGLGLPVAEGYAYWWYLQNVAHGTISGPQGMVLAGAATMFLLFGAAQFVLGLLLLADRLRIRTALGQGASPA